jgi:hypothetical protein
MAMGGSVAFVCGPLVGVICKQDKLRVHAAAEQKRLLGAAMSAIQLLTAIQASASACDQLQITQNTAWADFATELSSAFVMWPLHA